MKKYIFTFVLFVSMGLVLLSCNSADNGYNAPDGSTVTLTDSGHTFDAPDTGTVCVTSGLGTATFIVRVPIGTTCAPGSDPTTCKINPEQNSATLIPGNKIHGVITIAGGVHLYKFKDGVTTFLPEASLVDPVASGTFPFVTDDSGSYTFAYTATACYDSTGAIVTNSGQLTADIGVSIGTDAVTIQ